MSDPGACEMQIAEALIGTWLRLTKGHPSLGVKAGLVTLNGVGLNQIY